EIAAVDQLHRDMARILADHGVEDRDDVRMAQLPGERGFVEQLAAVHRAELRVAEHLGLDRLQRHFLAGEGVAREIDRSGRALAEQLLDVVLADLQAEVEGETGTVYLARDTFTGKEVALKTIEPE